MIVEVSDDLAFAMSLADLADQISAPRFAAKDFTIRAKADNSPVTDVDVQVEEALVAAVHAGHPSDSFLSEELGQPLDHRNAGRRWIVDGIDGTANFVAGTPAWGTLIALEIDDEIDVGIITCPGLRRRWWAARGAGAWTAPIAPNGAGQSPLRLSVRDSGRRAGVVLPPAGILDGWREQAITTATQYLQPTDATGHGPLLVASGDIDASVHLWGGAWDHAPFVVLVEEAGGQFTDLWGGRRIDTATAIFSNSHNHHDLQHAVAAVAPANPEL